MVLQRNRARHAQLVSHETETGGSDPNLPDFWDDEQQHLDPDIQIDTDGLHEDISMTTEHGKSQPRRSSNPIGYRIDGDEDEEEKWAREAAEAEEAELEAEELEIARRVEEAYGMDVPRSSQTYGEADSRMDMDWQAFDAMDIE